MDQMESLDPLELQENKVFLEYLVARGRLEILERRVPQDLLDNLVKLACLELRVAMGDQELLDLRDHKAIRVTQDPMGRQDHLVSMESMVSVDPLDQKVRKANLASQEHQESRALEVLKESLVNPENMARKETEVCKEALGPLECLAQWNLLGSLE